MTRARTRILGAVVAAIVCGVVAAGGSVIGPWPWGVTAAAFGLPGALVLGWRLAPWVASSSFPGAVLIGSVPMGLGAMAAGVVIIAAIAAVGTIVDPPEVAAYPIDLGAVAAPVQLVVSFIGFAVLGALYGFFVVTVLTIPCGIAWAAVVWLLARRARSAPW